jgi:aspartyl-tRNA(Asn)/glutamyl-tRNA(Gln) amidotransferase subunit A
MPATFWRASAWAQPNGFGALSGSLLRTDPGCVLAIPDGRTSAAAGRRQPTGPARLEPRLKPPPYLPLSNTRDSIPVDFFRDLHQAAYLASPLQYMGGDHMGIDALIQEPIARLAAGYRSGEVSPVAVTEAFLARIDRLNGPLHAYLRVTRERAMAEARAAELELRAGHDRGPLHGIPYAVKDIFDVKGMPTTAGTRLRADHSAPADCAAVQALARAGMVLLGKTHTVQFAMGPVGINTDMGTPHNPWAAVPHAPGGSSSGSAVAVAAGLAVIALGSDTGGSVRIPAALCGTVGLKTTVGRISRTGVYPLSWTLDSVGPLTRSVQDAAFAYMALQGPDGADATTQGIAPTDVMPQLTRGVRGLRLVVCESVVLDDAHPDVVAAIAAAADVLKALGASVEWRRVPEIEETGADADRLRISAVEACHFNAQYLDGHFEEMDPVVRTRMVTGRQMTAPAYFAALRRMAERRTRLLDAMRDIDAVLAPTVPVPAEPVADMATVEAYQRLAPKYSRNTSLGNFLNLCAVSVPCGASATGLPLGLMVHAKPFQEEMALRVAYAYEQATEWHQRHPTLGWASAGV